MGPFLLFLNVLRGLFCTQMFRDKTKCGTFMSRMMWYSMCVTDSEQDSPSAELSPGETGLRASREGKLQESIQLSPLPAYQQIMYISICNLHFNFSLKQLHLYDSCFPDFLEKEMATHSSFLAWKIPWTEEPGRLQSMGVVKSWTRLSDFTFP